MTFSIKHRNGEVDYGWKLAYPHPLPGTYKKGVWVEYTEEVSLVERYSDFLDIREIPTRFLTKQNI